MRERYINWERKREWDRDSNEREIVTEKEKEDKIDIVNRGTEWERKRTVKMKDTDSEKKER